MEYITNGPPMNNGLKNSMGYEPQMIKKLKATRDRSWAYTWLHRENAQYLKNWYDRISYLNIFLELLTATSIFVTASVCQNVYYVRILTGVISIISGFISALLKHEDYGQEIMKHKNASSKYSRIYDTIDNQLNTPVAAQQQAHHFHNWISHEFDTLFSTAPDLDEEVIITYTRKFGNKRPIHPIEVAEYEKDSDNYSSNQVEMDLLNEEHQSEISLSETDSDISDTDLEVGKDKPVVTDKPMLTESDESSKIHIEKTNHKYKSKKKSDETEEEIKKYLKRIRKNSTTDKFTPNLYNYQANRMSMNTDKCYIDPFKLEKPV